MNYEQYCKEVQEEREFLNSLPLEKYIKDWIEIYDMMQQIEEDYGKLRPSGFVFNVTEIDDFLIYLTKRYPNLTYSENTQYHLYLDKE